MAGAIMPNSIVRFCCAVIVCAITAWLLCIAVDMPSQSADMIMPEVHCLTACLLLISIVRFIVSGKQIGFCSTDAFAALIAMTVAFSALCYGAKHPRYEEFTQAAMFYLAMRMAFSAEPKLKNAVMALLFCLAIYEGVTGIRQAFGVTYSNHSLFKITGTFFNPGPFAGFIVPIAVCAVVYVLTYSWIPLENFRNKESYGIIRHYIWRAAYFIAVAAAVISIIVIPATMSRAAWVAAGFATLIFIVRETTLVSRIGELWTQHRWKFSLWVFVAMSAIFAIGVLSYYAKRQSADGRLLIWKMDSRIICDNMLRGVGLGNFAGAFGKEQAEYFSEKARPEAERMVAGCPESGFNEYLQFGAETGVVGMLSLVAMVVSGCLAGVRRHDPYGYGLMAAAVFAMFSYPFSVLPLRLMFVLLLAASVSYKGVGSKRDNIARYLYCVVSAVLLALIPVLDKRSRERATAVAAWEDVRVWMSSERYDYIIEDGVKLYEILKYDFRFLYDYGYALHKLSEYSLSNEILFYGAQQSSDPMFYNIMGKNSEALGDISRAEEYYSMAHDMIPSRIYPLYLKAMMYDRIGNSKRAVETAQTALRMNVKVESEQTRELKKELWLLIEKYR
ncbi:MAG: O-antigen ligase family protein [Alistipes sp.]|nr:O-antigen ligase family protein [Alistipes sp.]